MPYAVLTSSKLPKQVRDNRDFLSYITGPFNALYKLKTSG